MSFDPERDARCARLIPLVASIARGLMRVYRCGEYSDVFQDGCLGMIRAVTTYDPERGVPLESYARKIIAGAILNGIRARDPLSEHARGLLREAERERERSIGDRPAGTPPTMEGMAKRLSGLGAAMLMAHRAKTLSLDEPLPAGETIAPNWDDDPARLVTERENVRRLHAAIGDLSERQRAVITAYYFGEKTVKRVGEDLDISAQRVSQLHQSALGNMRKALATR